MKPEDVPQSPFSSLCRQSEQIYAPCNGLFWPPWLIYISHGGKRFNWREGFALLLTRKLTKAGEDPSIPPACDVLFLVMVVCDLASQCNPNLPLHPRNGVLNLQSI